MSDYLFEKFASVDPKDSKSSTDYRKFGNVGLSGEQTPIRGTP